VKSNGRVFILLIPYLYTIEICLVRNKIALPPNKIACPLTIIAQALASLLTPPWKSKSLDTTSSRN